MGVPALIEDKSSYVVLFMKDPHNCGGCVLNDPYNFACKITKQPYTAKNLQGDNKPVNCPLINMYREPYGNFKIVNNE